MQNVSFQGFVCSLCMNCNYFGYCSVLYVLYAVLYVLFCFFVVVVFLLFRVRCCSVPYSVLYVRTAISRGVLFFRARNRSVLYV